MKKILLPVLLCGSVSLFAQKAAKPEPFAKTITAADLKKHLYIVAGPEMEGRETATEGQRKAAAYIENEFRRIGLQPGNNGSFQQHYTLYQDSLAGARLEINGQPFQLFQDFTISPSNSIAGTFRLGEVVAIGKGNAAKTDSVNLAGKMVLLFQNVANPQTIAAIRAKGPAGVMILPDNYKAPAAPQSRIGRLTVQAFPKSLPMQQLTVSEAIGKAILKDHFEAAKNATNAPKAYAAELLLQVDKAPIMHQSSNVAGLLPGTDKADEYLVITAHYDHEGKRENGTIFYGADDDGSGTVSVIELAEAFAKAKKEGRGPRRSIVFMTVSGEEKGLLGSEYYAAHPLFPLEKTTANLNIDMIGRIDPKRKVGDSTNYVYVVGDDKLSTELRPISEAANKYTKLELDYKYNDPNDQEFIYYRSDHYNFAKNGVPIIFYFNGTHADYHRPTDTPDKINYELMEKRARLVFYTAWEMANRNEMLKRDLELPVLRR